MPRTAARVDSNQSEIVKGLRMIGYSVLLLHQVGKGCPDILIGRAGNMMLIEIKNSTAIKRKNNSLTPDENVFIEGWRGTPVFVGATLASIHDRFIELHNTDK